MDGFNDLAEDAAEPILRAGMQQIVRSPRRTLRKEVRPFIFMGIIPRVSPLTYMTVMSNYDHIIKFRRESQ